MDSVISEQAVLSENSHRCFADVLEFSQVVIPNLGRKHHVIRKGTEAIVYCLVHLILGSLFHIFSICEQKGSNEGAKETMKDKSKWQTGTPTHRYVLLMNKWSSMPKAACLFQYLSRHYTGHCRKVRTSLMKYSCYCFFCQPSSSPASLAV